MMADERAGSLLSVNVGMPQDLDWHGKTVHTAVWKRPVHGSGQVHGPRLNIDGDGQGDLAGHGGEQRAVMVYQMDSYRYWERNWAAPILTSDSSARTSLSKVCRITKCVSVTVNKSAARYSKSRNHG